MRIILNFCRLNGHPGDSAHTYDMITGYFHAGRGMGAIVGPLAGGALTENFGLPWATTILTFINTGFVSKIN